MKDDSGFWRNWWLFAIWLQVFLIGQGVLSVLKEISSKL